MTDNTYNGWTNWETWNLLLWVTNEESLYKEATHFAHIYSSMMAFEKKCEDFFRRMFPEGTPDMKEEEMQAVNWAEVAQALKEWDS